MSVEFKTYIPTVKILNKKILGGDYNIGEFLKRGSGSSNLNQPANSVVLEFIPSSKPDYPNYTGINSVPYWLKTIKKNDLISVGIESKNSYLYKIDGIFRTRVVTERGAEEGIRVIGRSLVSVLLDDDITFAPDLAHNRKSIELLGALRSTFLGFIDGLRGLVGEGSQSQFLAQHPLAAVLWIFLNMPAVNAKIFYLDYDEEGNPLGKAGIKTIGALFDFDFYAYEKDLLYDPQLNMFTGKVWNYIMQCMDPMFYELYEETRIKYGQLRPTIIIRPKPFDRTTDNQRIKDDIIVNLKVEREGDVNQGDFNINPIKRTVQNVETQVYEVTIKGFKNGRFEPTSQIERVSLFWDNQNAEVKPPGKTKTSFTPLTGTEPTTVIPPKRGISNAFKTFVTDKLYHTVPDEEDYQCTVGSTTKDVVNFITMHATKDLTDNDELARWGYLFPIVDCYSLLQYGCRRMEGKTLMMHLPSDKSVSWKDYTDKDQFSGVPEGTKVYPLFEATKLRDRLFSWYRYNPLFLNGSCKVLGHDYYRKGDKIYFPGHYTEDGYRGVYYYLQGVSWNFSVSQSDTNYFSFLELSRGESPESLESYRYQAGYDLYDEDIETDSKSVPGQELRRNPVLRVDALFVPESPQTDLQNTDPENVSAKDQRNDIGVVGNKNPTKDNSVDGNGYDTLTDVSMNTVVTGYEKFVSNGVYGLKKVSFKQVLSAIYQAAQDNGINPNILVALFQGESSFNPKAVSKVKDKKGRISNAVGLGQHMGFPENAKYFSREISKEYTSPLSEDGRYDAIENILASGSFLREVKGWGLLPVSKVKALNSYYGTGGTSKSSYYVSYLKIKKYLPSTELTP